MASMIQKNWPQENEINIIAHNKLYFCGYQNNYSLHCVCVYIYIYIYVYIYMQVKFFSKYRSMELDRKGQK